MVPSGRRILSALRYLKAYAIPPRPPGSRSDAEYAEFLAGAKVAIVGPAPSIVGSGLGPRIDSYDRVVRLNHALPIRKDLEPDLGTRTDVLYHNLWQRSPKAIPFQELVGLLKGSVQWVCASHPYTNAGGNHAGYIDAFLDVLQNQVPFRTVSPRPYIRIKVRNRCLPSAGISAIQDLLQLDIEELFITGFTFYQGKEVYHEGYRGVGLISWLHSPERQLAQMMHWVQTDSRIRLDATLRDILSR